MSSLASRHVAGAALALCVAACGQEGSTASSSGDGGGEASTTGSSSSGPGSGGGGGMLPAPVPIAILDWNVHNFLNDKNDSDAPDESYVSGAAYAAHRKAIGTVISTLDPDIAVL